MSVPNLYTYVNNLARSIMDKYYVYVVDGDCIVRRFVDSAEVIHLLKSDPTIQVLRSYTSQVAIVKDDQLFWIDVETSND